MATTAFRVSPHGYVDFRWRHPLQISRINRPPSFLKCQSKPIIRAIENEVGTEVEIKQEIEEETPQSLREKEKFVIRDLGKYQCRSCGYVYDQTVGDPSYPVPPGVEFSKLPEDWRCSTCGAAKSYFNSISVEVAGFAENQSYGFGTNTLTSGQKGLLIYGSLVLFFLLFLGGYFLN